MSLRMWLTIRKSMCFFNLQKWKEVCLAEIEFCSLRKILENLDPKFYIHHKLDIWKTAYSNWHQWLCLPKWSFTQKVLHKLSNCEITSVVNSGYQ